MIYYAIKIKRQSSSYKRICYYSNGYHDLDALYQHEWSQYDREVYDGEYDLLTYEASYDFRDATLFPTYESAMDVISILQCFISIKEFYLKPIVVDTTHNSRRHHWRMRLF